MVQEALQTILGACTKEFNIPWGLAGNPQNLEERIRQGYRFTVFGSTLVPQTMEIGRRG